MSYKPDSISSIKLVIFPSIQVLYNDCTNLYTSVQNLVTTYAIYSITSSTIKTQRKSPETRINAGFTKHFCLFKLNMSQVALNLFCLSFSLIWGIFIYQLHYLF